MKTAKFFRQYPVFTTQEFTQIVGEGKSHGKRAAEALLAYHVKVKHLIRIRKGLYAAVPAGNNIQAFSPDPYLIAMKLTSDAVLGYHAALAFHGKAYSVSNQFQILTHHRSNEVYFANYVFQLVQLPKALRIDKQVSFGIKSHFNQYSIPLRVTNLERTLVDALDQPELSGGWEEVWRSLESIDYFDLEQVIQYALLLKRTRTICLLGFYLEQHKEQLHVQENHLQKLEAHRLKQPYYLGRHSKQPVEFVSRWNLIVPVKILQRNWEEF